jgi:hypothetical protein
VFTARYELNIYISSRLIFIIMGLKNVTAQLKGRNDIYGLSLLSNSVI